LPKNFEIWGEGEGMTVTGEWLPHFDLWGGFEYIKIKKISIQDS
jgi:hypothetical protein